jgi:hypothetical protein
MAHQAGRGMSATSRKQKEGLLRDSISEIRLTTLLPGDYGAFPCTTHP